MHPHPHLASAPILSDNRTDPVSPRRPQVCVLGSAEPGSRAYELAAAAGELCAKLGITLVSRCGSPATRVAAERALAAGDLVVSIIPSDDIHIADWPCSLLIPCGIGILTTS